MPENYRDGAFCALTLFVFVAMGLLHAYIPVKARRQKSVRGAGKFSKDGLSAGLRFTEGGGNKIPAEVKSSRQRQIPEHMQASNSTLKSISR